jgi:predicted nucleic acid-binding protein
VSDFVLDASLALQWFLEDETERKYSLSVLVSPSEKRALVSLLWFYEIGNGLLMASRRKRITVAQIEGFLTRLRTLPIDVALQTPAEILDLLAFADYAWANYLRCSLPGAGKAVQPSFSNKRLHIASCRHVRARQRFYSMTLGSYHVPALVND